MTDKPNPADELIRMIHGDRLINPPDGGKMRQPWKEYGMSRATYYRLGKPNWPVKNAKDNWKWRRQASQARSDNHSIRTEQRRHFVYRYGIPELRSWALHNCLPLGMLEEIAKWEHEDQYRFFVRLLELATPISYEGGKTDLPLTGILDNWDDCKRHSECWTIWVDRTELRRAARQARQEIIAEIFAEVAP